MTDVANSLTFSDPNAKLNVDDNSLTVGSLNISGGSFNIIDSGELSLNGPLSGGGTINDTGSYSYLTFDNTQAASDVTINLGNTGYYSYLVEDDTADTGDKVLTLGSNVTIDESGYATIETGDDYGDGIVNQGVINQSGTGGSFYIYGDSFTNSGTITAGLFSSGLMWAFRARD